MKKVVYLMLCVLPTFCGVCQSKKLFNSTMPIENGIVTYRDTILIPNTVSVEIKHRLDKWLIKELKTVSNISVFNGRNEKEIVVKRVFLYDWEITFSKYIVAEISEIYTFNIYDDFMTSTLSNISFNWLAINDKIETRTVKLEDIGTRGNMDIKKNIIFLDFKIRENIEDLKKSLANQ
jgi:hypothetical protein